MKTIGPVAALVAIMGACIFHALTCWVNVDDAFIAFRYADNLSNGLGLVFNAGEQVEGYTSFLWVVLLAGLHHLGADTPAAAQILGLLFGVAVLPVVYLLGQRHWSLGPWVALLPCCVVAASGSVAMWTGAGLETAFFTFVLTCAVARGLIEVSVPSSAKQAPPRAIRPLFGLLFALAALTRPEAAGLFAIFCVYALIFRLGRPRLVLLNFIGFVLVFAPHFAFRLHYYGLPLPNTFYAKTSLSSDMVLDGAIYLADFLLTHGPWALLGLLGHWVGVPSGRRALALLPLTLLGAAACYIVLVGGDIYPCSRFCLPYLPLLALSVCGGLDRLVTRFRPGPSLTQPIVAVVIMGSVAVTALVWPPLKFDKSLESLWRSDEVMRRYGLWFREKRPTALLAVSSLGRIPYFSGLQTIDMLGLADRHIAHRKMKLTRGFLGHQKYDSAYVLSRKPDIVALEYGTTDPLFNPNVDLHTEKIYQRVLPSKGWWPALGDLLGRRDFRLRYAPRAALVSPNKWLLFFERDDTLLRRRRQVKPASTNPKAHFELSLLHRRHGLLDGAISCMQRVVELDPANVTARLNIGYFLMEDGRHKAALDHFMHLSTTLRHPHVQYGIAMALHSMGRYGEASVAWRRFLRVAPGSRFAGQARKKLLEAVRPVQAKRAPGR